MAVLPLCVVPPVLPRVAVVMGSDSDLPTMEPAAAILREWGWRWRSGALGPSHPLGDGELRSSGPGSGVWSDRCRRWRGGPSSRHGGCPNHPARDRRAGEKPGAVRGRLPPLDRADAGGGFRWPPSPSVEASMPGCWRRRSFRWPTLTWPGNLRITAAAFTMLWSPRMRAWLIWAALITYPR